MNNVTYYTLGNATFTFSQLMFVILAILGSVALTFILAKTFETLFLRMRRRWDNRNSLQRKLSRWDCVRPRVRL